MNSEAEATARDIVARCQWWGFDRQHPENFAALIREITAALAASRAEGDGGRRLATARQTLTAEQLEVIKRRAKDVRDFPFGTSDLRERSARDVPTLLAHIAALEGELSRRCFCVWDGSEVQNECTFHALRRLDARERCDALQAALREVVEALGWIGVSVALPWSEPTARVLKELGL